MKWILSYPRSGSHLVRVWIEALTGIPTASIYPNDPYPMGPPPPGFSREDNATPVFTKIHRFVHANPLRQHQLSRANRLIRVDRLRKRKTEPAKGLLFRLRNPRACIASDARDTPRVLRPVRFPIEASRYLRNCTDFLDWHGPKLLLYYEDMVGRPERSIETLGAFVGAERTSIERCTREAPLLAAHGISMLRRRPLSRQDPSRGANRFGPLVPLTVVPRRVRPLLERYGRAGSTRGGSASGL
jgi:hypothetical protein